MSARELISSVANPLVKRARSLRRKRERDEHGAFLVEGLRPVRSALESQADVECVIVAPDLLTSEGARRAVEAHRSAGGSVVEVTQDVFASLSERERPMGLAAIVRGRPQNLEDLVVAPDSLFIALDDVHGPGNLGSIIRTADATGAAVVVVGEATDPYHPQAVKASMGALFHVPIARSPSVDHLLEWATTRSVRVVATSARRGRDHWATAYDRPLALLFGSEAHGLADDVIERTAECIRIPMEGGSSSLNLTAAAAVVAYEAVAARRGRPRFG